MGEIADQMLNGEICEMCGVCLDYSKDGGPNGIPMYCSEKCALDRGIPKEDVWCRIYN